MRIAIATTLLLCACTVEPELRGESAPIVNGEIDKGDPAVVELGGFCSGTLVAPKVVLTARHCLSSGSTPGFSVFFGTYGSGEGTRIRAVHQATYSGAGSDEGDLGMVTLEAPGPADPIPVNDRDLSAYIGDTVRIAGFGVTSESGGGGGVKRVGESVLESVTSGTMFSDNVPSGTCYGDSGGPNFMTFDGVEYLVGATSYGTAACGSGLDASARTDTYIDWIRAYIAEHDPADCGSDGQCASDCGMIDPDCPCADDGFCTADCPDLSTDPDCDGCGDDGICRADCPVLDEDCCAEDGACTEECGDLDPDCGGGDDGGGDDDDDDDGAGGDDDDDGSAGTNTITGGCTVGHRGSDAASWLILLLGLALLLRRRRLSTRSP